MAETGQTPVFPTAEAEPKPEPVPSLEEAVASLGAAQIGQGEGDSLHKFSLWYADFKKKEEDKAKKPMAEHAKTTKGK